MATWNETKVPFLYSEISPLVGGRSHAFLSHFERIPSHAVQAGTLVQSKKYPDMLASVLALVLSVPPVTFFQVQH